jgi:hypothetical protein
LAEYADGPALKQLFEALNVRVWAKFKKVQKGKRLLNKFNRGLITTGNAPWPIKPYNGPRNGSSANKKPARSTDRPGSNSLHKVHRGETRWQ